MRIRMANTMVLSSPRTRDNNKTMAALRTPNPADAPGIRNPTSQETKTNASAEASENGLAKLPDKTVTTILSTTGVREHVPGNLAQSDRIIQFPVRQQPSVGSDLGTLELKLEPTVKIQPQNTLFRFTHRVSHVNIPNPPIT